MSAANFSRGPNGDLIYYPKASKTESPSKGDPTKWLEVKHEVKDYKPEEICIKVTNIIGKIEGNHKTKFASKSFYKEFIIPNGVNIEQLDISLSANGILSIFAPIGNGFNAGGSSVSQRSKQFQESVQSKSKKDESKVSQIEINKAVSSTTETTRKVKQENVAEFSSDVLNNSRIEDISREIRQIEQGNTTKKFEIRINVKEYSTENIQVKISKQMVVISGKIVTKSTRKEFNKKFSIPYGVEPGSITNSLDTTTGILTISAPINETQNNQISTRDTNVSSTQKTTATSLQQSINTQQQQQITAQEQIQQQREIRQTQQQQFSQTQQQFTDSTESTTQSTVVRTTTTSQTMIERECTLNSTLDLDNRMQTIPDSICEYVPQRCIVHEGDALEVNIELPNFAPEDVQIRVNKTTVTIIGKREIIEQNRVSREEIFKKFTIPFGIRPEDITSTLQTNGVLRITNNKTSTKQQALTNKGQQVTPKPATVSRGVPDSPALGSALPQRPTEDVGKVEPTVDLTTEVNNEELRSHEDLTNVIRKVEDENKMEVKLNVSNFKRDEVKVKVYKRTVIIEARNKTTTRTTTTLLKKLTIPDDVRPEQISFDINPSGILTITAPISEPKPATVSRVPDSLPGSTLPQRPNEDVALPQRPNEDIALPQRPKEDVPLPQRPNEDVALPQRPKEEVGKVEPVVDLTTEINSDELPSHEDLTNVIRKVEEGDKIEVNLNVSDFKRDEVNVKIYKRTVIIEARNKSTTKKTTTLLKKLTIPDGVRPEQISCDINPSGILTITAPASSPTPVVETPQSPETVPVLSQRPNEDVRKDEPITETRSPDFPTNVPVFYPRPNEDVRKIEPISQISVPDSPANVPVFYEKPNEDVGNVEPITEIRSPDFPSNVPVFYQGPNEDIGTVEPISETRVPDSPANVPVFYERPNEDVGKVEPVVDLTTEINSNELPTHEDLTDVIRKVEEGDKIEVTLNVSDFKRDEVKVTINKRTVIIEARNKTTTKTTTTLLKKLTIPDGVRPEQISCDINPSGILTITAPTSAPTSAAETPQSPETVPVLSQRPNEDVRKVEPITETRSPDVPTNVPVFYPRPNEDVGKVEPTVDLTTEINNDELTSHEDLTNVIRKVDEGNKIEVNLNVSEFKRDEVKVTIYKRIVIIEARNKTTTRTTTTLLKKLPIPDGVRPEQILCDINPSGILTITAPASSPESPASVPVLSQRPNEDVGRVEPIVDLATEINNDELKSYEDLTNVIRKIDDGKKVEVTLDVSDFKRDEVKVTIYKKIVIIEVRNKTTTRTTTTLLKKLPIPDGVRPEQISCDINPSGILTITAPASSPESPASVPVLSQRPNEDVGRVEPIVDLTTEINNDELKSYEDLTNVIRKVDDGKKVEVTLDVSDFKRDEVKVTIYKKIVIIEVRNKTTTRTTTTLLKKLPIPDGVRPEQISCDINPSGILTITAPASSPESPASVPVLSQRPNEDVGRVEPIVDLTTEINNDELKSYEDLTNVIRKVDDGKKVEVTLNVSDFKRDEVKVTIYKRIVIIEARNKTTTRTTTTLLRKLTIPDNVRPEQISCDINPSGILTITAPASAQRPNEDIGRVVPIVDLSTEINNDELTSYEDLTNVIRKVDDGKKIEVNLNVSDFKRDEVKVTIYRRTVIIEVRKRTTTTTTTTTTTKSLLKKLTIPDGVRPEQISCDINSSGILTITALVEKVTDSKQEQLQKQVDRSKNLAATNSTQTSSKKARSLTLKTSIVSAESLSSYDFDNATTTVYDPTGRTLFEETVEINEYRPEDIEIKMAYNVKGFNIVIVEGNQEMTAENGWRSKSFNQMFSVPEGVKLETIECTMDLDENNIGLLTCTAPIQHK